jgi:ubiquinone/menaquinone biosynthesis C-methylase UbiE
MTTAVAPRYDGHADWYDDYNREAAEANAVEIAAMLGPGDGLCLDIGCGTGQYFEMIRSTGRTPVGIDFSGDQLRLAGQRSPLVARSDAALLPFRDGSFRTVTTLWVSTDVDDFGAVLTEVTRVLEPGGTLLFFGVHPCFNGPHVQAGEGDTRIVHPTYRQAGWHRDAPWWGENIRRKVGMRQMPLAELLNAFAGAGLVIEHAVEPREIPIPWALALRARRLR